jgi:hypothetical protein
MSKRAIKLFTVENDTITFNDLKAIVYSVKKLSGKAKTNSNLSREFVFNEIFKPYFENLEKNNTDMNEIIITTSFKVNVPRPRISLNSNGIIMCNILNECEYKIKK